MFGRRSLVAVLLLASASAALAQGVGKISGTVRAGSRPVAGARVILDDTRELRSDSAGTFQFDSVPVGRHRVQALTVGAKPVIHDVGVIADYTSKVDIVLERVIVLDSVRVEGNTVRLGYVRAFEARKKQAFGRYLDSTKVRQYGEFHQAMSFVTGVRTVVEPQFRQTIIVFGYDRCLPDVWIDGTNWGRDQGPLRTLRTDDVMAVEIYNHTVPEPFFNQRNRCGALVVWTRRLWPEGAQRRP